jgi:hypothetical protein
VLDLLLKNIRWIGVFAIAVSVITWWIDLSGLVYECVYCRTQRTAIGVVGLLLILPDPGRWWLKWPTTAIAFLGASVAADQIFLVIKNINAGRDFGLLNLTMASGALLMLTGIVLLLFALRQRED